MTLSGMRNRLTALGAALLVAGIGIVAATDRATAATTETATAVAPAAAAPPITALAVVSSPVGVWTLTTDFGCDGSITGAFTQTFNADGTWTSSPFVHSGRWYQVGGIVVWSFADTANLIYSGNLSGSWFSGAQGYELAGGINGCFGGRLASVATKGEAPATAGRVDPATNR